ncbi:hypothetical protein BV25DRAFT_1815297 [Artomyces pyxidatus]|uniref:Uncharacterized protein n=1 Tax=Artomyces pyxidatus TaxID=48021 RepID=A0ACB8SIG2_9AGAM|nr:hypothetical protein BV25DRAFT_1815297 [Artomyces pyxidatus]
MDEDEIAQINADARMQQEQQLLHDPTIVKFPIATAGAPLNGVAAESYVEYGGKLAGGAEHRDDNPWAPFANELEWELVRWAKTRGPTSTAFTDLLQIKGLREKLELSFKNVGDVNTIIDNQLPTTPAFNCEEVEVDGEKYEVYFRDILACVRSLYGNPEFSPFMTYAPERHFCDEEKTNRVFDEMHTGDWWWKLQTVLEGKEAGATIVPCILSSDKTQLTTFRNKSAYPVYLTIGNIAKNIRRKPSMHGQVLIGYLPTANLIHIKNKETRRRAVANLFHACMSKIVAPLKAHGVNGMPMKGGDGVRRRCHPIFAAFVGDYPEQALVACIKYGECPKCKVKHENLGAPEPSPPRSLAVATEALKTFDRGPAEYVAACQAAGIKPVFQPFWEDLPYSNVFTSITPDILHQLYQGMIKHLLLWLKKAFGPEEIDARCRRLPRNHNLRHFSAGISHLSRVSGQEHKDICRILLGLVVDLRLPGNVSTIRLVRAVRGLLDFLYLSQYPSHSTETLAYLDDALVRFHANKSIFTVIGIREHFNLPKLHSLLHYTPSIRLFGTTDNYNTEYSERLHIDFAKDAYRATNHKDVYPQMTRWLQRKEQILRHEKYIAWQIKNLQAAAPPHLATPAAAAPPIQSTTRIARFPNVKSASFQQLGQIWGAVDFEPALLSFILQLRNPGLTGRQIAQRRAEMGDAKLPFRSVATYHTIKFTLADPQERKGAPDVRDAAHARPAYHDTRDRLVPGRFDTVLVDTGAGEDIGVRGYRVAQIRVIFSLSIKARDAVFTDNDLAVAPTHMAYVEWFDPFPGGPEANHIMYRLSRSYKDGRRLASIIPVANIKRSIHLTPRFGPVAPREWTSSNVLELCQNFYVTCFSDRHTYITVY